MLPIATTLLPTLDVGVRIDVGLCFGTVRARVGLVELQLLSCSWTLTRPTRRTRVCTVCVRARVRVCRGWVRGAGA